MRFNINSVLDSLLTTIFQFTDGNNSLSKPVFLDLQFRFPIETPVNNSFSGNPGPMENVYWIVIRRKWIVRTVLCPQIYCSLRMDTSSTLLILGKHLTQLTDINS